MGTNVQSVLQPPPPPPRTTLEKGRCSPSSLRHVERRPMTSEPRSKSSQRQRLRRMEKTGTTVPLQQPLCPARPMYRHKLSTSGLFMSSCCILGVLIADLSSLTKCFRCWLFNDLQFITAWWSSSAFATFHFDYFAIAAFRNSFIELCLITI